MGKIIVYLEDDAGMRYHTIGMLKDSQYVVEGFRRIDQVKEYFEDHLDEIICIITDLNMSDEWLGEYQAESDGGLLSGWVWLQRFVYPKKKIKTIIYSGYIPYLRSYLSNQGKEKELEADYIQFVEKGANQDEGFQGLKKKMQEFLKEELKE